MRIDTRLDILLLMGCVVWWNRIYRVVYVSIGRYPIQ
jgi:hypothetical protein